MKGWNANQQNKKDMTELLSDVFDGATIMVGGFGEAGSPIELLHWLN